MLTQLKAKVMFQITSMKPGNEMGTKARSGEMVINGTAISFVLQKSSWGRFGTFSKERETHVAIMGFEQIRKTRFTENGYISLLFTMDKLQFWAYIKESHYQTLILAMARRNNV